LFTLVRPWGSHVVSCPDFSSSGCAGNAHGAVVATAYVVYSGVRYAVCPDFNDNPCRESSQQALEAALDGEDWQPSRDYISEFVWPLFNTALLQIEMRKELAEAKRELLKQEVLRRQTEVRRSSSDKSTAVPPCCPTGDESRQQTCGTDTQEVTLDTR